MSESYDDQLEYEGGGLPRDTNWWGAFVIGLAGTILVTGIAPVMVTSLGASSIPPIVLVTMLAGIQGIVESSNQRHTEDVTRDRVNAARAVVGSGGAPLPADTARDVTRLGGASSVTDVVSTDIYPVDTALATQSPCPAARLSGTPSASTLDLDVVRGSLETVGGDAVAVSRVFAENHLVALPVVDDQRRMKGIVTVDDMVDVVREEATEDMQKVGGVAALDAPYLQIRMPDMLRKRVGWLSVLFLGEMLTASAMAFFEREIARAVVLALFVPLIISSGGNSGSQASTLIIRAMALRELWPSKQALDDAIASGSTGTGGAAEQFELLDELLVTLVGS